MLQCLNAEESREVREFLRDSGYTMQALTTHFGTNEVAQLQLLKLSIVGNALEPNRQNTLYRWFWVGAPVDAATAREVIPEHTLGLFLKSGLVLANDVSLSSPYRISPFNEFLVVSDNQSARTGALSADTVLWPNPTSLMCYQLSMQAPVGRTLDLGTGNGVLALTLAPHSESVIATDLNPRARQFTEFNAALNGFSNIEYREGSAFEPVSGERFDLILANPPFFVTPSVRRVFSDNSMELDGFCRTLVREAPDHLNEGGYCQMLAEWVEVKGQPWRDRLGEWVAGIGCDAWVLSSYMRSSLDYALIRQQDDRNELSDPAAQAALTKSWETYFATNQVEAIYGGIIVLRKRAGRNWVRMEELQAPVSRPFGEFMRRVFTNRDFLGSHSDEQLLEARPVLNPTSRLQKQLVASPEGWKLASVELQLREGLPYSLAFQPQVADFVGLCDGSRTLGEIADQLASDMSIDPAMVRRESCGIVRRVADYGMVLL